MWMNVILWLTLLKWNKMNTIFFSKRHELRKDYYVIPFSCSDLMDIDTLKLHRDRTETEQKVLDTIVDRITLALLRNGYILQSVNFSSMSISCIVDEYQVKMYTKVSDR
jgi:hypothetical protein